MGAECTQTARLIVSIGSIRATRPADRRTGYVRERRGRIADGVRTTEYRGRSAGDGAGGSRFRRWWAADIPAEHYPDGSATEHSERTIGVNPQRAHPAGAGESQHNYAACADGP